MTTSGGKSRVRALSGALDQAFSSISNGFIVYAVAVVASPEAFGNITILMTSLMAALSCVRGGFGIPLLLKADHSIEDVRREGSFALVVVFLLGPVVSLGMLVIAPRVDVAVIALALSAPFVLGQDVLRYVAMASGRPHVAAIWDGVWSVGTLGALVCAWIGFPFVNAGAVLGSWGFFALIAFVAMSIDLRIVPSVPGLLGWIGPGWQHRFRYAADAGLEQVGLLVVFGITSTMVNPDATGALRGAIALLAPILIVASAIQLVLIPESVRSSAPPYQVWRTLVTLMTVLMALAVLVGVVFSVLPAGVGRLLLGESFVSSQDVLPVMTAQFIAAGVTFAILVYLRTFNRSADVLRLKLIYLVAITVATLMAARWVGSATGVALGMTAATALVAVGAYFTLSPRREKTVLGQPGLVSDDAVATAPRLRDVPPSSRSGRVRNRMLVGATVASVASGAVYLAVRRRRSRPASESSPQPRT